jgi:hypothetical protein
MRALIKATECSCKFNFLTGSLQNTFYTKDREHRRMILSALRLVILFGLVFSMVSLAGLSGAPRFPDLRLAHANSPTNDSNWYPGGPSMETLFMPKFTDQALESSSILSYSPTIDFSDGPLAPLLDSTAYAESTVDVTRSQWFGFNEIEFNLATNIWGCPFNFGNETVGSNGKFVNCGIYIRQGIAHLIDKTIFATQEPDIAGTAAAIDNPLSAGSSLPTPNSCGWDGNFLVTGPECIVGGTNPGGSYYTGGTAYHLAPASGVNSVPWEQANPSPDFCAGAYDISKGVNLVSGGLGGLGVGLARPPGGTFPSGSPSTWTFNSSTDCHLVFCCGTNFDQEALAVGANPVKFYIRTDNPALEKLGFSFADVICAVWGGTSDASGCPFVPVNGHQSSTIPILLVAEGADQYFTGYMTSTGSSPTTSWSMFTAGATTYVPANPFENSREHFGQLTKQYCNNIGCDPFDMNLYYTFNSRFVSGITSIQPPNGTCSSTFPSQVASNYMYLCNPSYDSISALMEYAPCLSSQGDPTAGQTTPTFANCLGTSQLSAVSAGYQTENDFGQNAFAIPVYTTSVEYAYVNGWNRAINSAGTFNYFNWLNAWNPAPAQTGTIRQGVSGAVGSLSPYVANSPLDYAVIGAVYDSLWVANPYDQGQVFDWMTSSVTQLANSQLTYQPPPGTMTTYRFNLLTPQGLTFQDGRAVTSFDVAFSYLTLSYTGSMLGGTLANVTGITILGPRQFDIGLSSWGPFILPAITAPPILPGRYWTSAATPSLWDNAVGNCNSNCAGIQFTLTGSHVNCTGPCSNFNGGSGSGANATVLMTVDPSKIVASYDPIANNIFIGSGPWQCGTGPSLGGACSNTGYQTGTLTLTSNGNYIHSSTNLALWVWASNGNPLGPSTLTYSFASACFNAVGVPVGTSGVPSSYTTGGSSTAQACSHWQEGIGGPSGTVAAGTVGTALSTDPKIQFVGTAPFTAGDTIIYNSVGATTYQAGDQVISGTAPSVGTPLTNDPLLKFYDNPSYGSPGVWVNGKSVIYDTDNSGGYDFGDISSSQYANNLGQTITPAPGIHLNPPPPGGCPASATNGCWQNEGSTQVGILGLRTGFNWITPFNWALSAPTSIGALPPVLYQPNSTVPLNPASVASTGCNNAFSSTSTTSGGYDC